ncbi:MAG: hypothetical protein ACAF41_19580 [Leptolyngbya sp. BL-A-14]
MEPIRKNRRYLFSYSMHQGSISTRGWKRRSHPLPIVSSTGIDSGANSGSMKRLR